MIEKIKALRVQIDGLAQLTKELKPNKGFVEYNISMEANAILFPGNTKEIEKAYDSLILAKAWLGKILDELKDQTPYANDGSRHTVEHIEPAADTKAYFDNQFPPKVENEEIVERNHIEKVDWLRQEIQKVADNKLSLDDYTPEEQHLKEAPAKNEFFYDVMYQQYLIEARFWLGFELQRIKENEKI